MSSDEVVQEKIKIQLVRFQVYVFTLIPLSAGFYGLVLNYHENLINKITTWFGAVLLVWIFYAIFNHFILIRRYIKQLDKTT